VHKIYLLKLESFYYWNTSNFEIIPELVSKLEVCCKVDRFPTGLTAQLGVKIARWDSNKTTLCSV